MLIVWGSLTGLTASYGLPQNGRNTGSSPTEGMILPFVRTSHQDSTGIVVLYPVEPALCMQPRYL